MLDNKRTVITLGYFDSVHIGHRQIINKALKLAKDLDATLTVFSFNGDLKGKISQHSKYVYNPKERCEIFYKLGASEVFLAPLTKKYLSKGKLAFLNDLNAKLNILCLRCWK